MIIEPTPPLPKEEELRLVKLYQETKDETAGNLLVSSNIRFIYKIAWEVMRKGTCSCTMEELVLEGCYGLFVSLHAFNPELNFKLMTYAEDGIRQRMYRYINSIRHDDAISLQEPITEDGMTVEETIKDTSPEITDVLISKDDGYFLGGIVKFLTEKERFIVKSYFWEELDFLEIGKRLNISRARVQQIFGKAIRKLRYHGIKNRNMPYRNTILKLGDRYIDISSSIKNRSY